MHIPGAEVADRCGAFYYHFWSKHMPKLSYYQKKGTFTPLKCVKDEESRRLVLNTVRAIEMHMILTCIAMGIPFPAVYWRDVPVLAPVSEDIVESEE